MAATLNSRYIKGNLVFYQTHRKRLVDALGIDVVKYIDDFTAGQGTDATFDDQWTVTRVEAGLGGESTITRVDGVGGLARITTDNAENDGINAQLIGEAWELTTDQELYFGAFGVNINDVTQTDFFLGLAITDTDILGGVTDRIGFQSIDGETALKFAVEKNSTETLSASLATLADATSIDLEFYYSGMDGNLEVFVNGASVATPATTNLPNDEQLRISWQFLTGEAVANTMDIDKLVCIMIGR